MVQRGCESPWQSCISHSLINTISSLLPLFLPAGRPVILVVLHHTFDPNYIAPDSKWCMNREGVFTVDVLFHEDEGLLRSLHNDRELKRTTDHLLSLNASPVNFEQLAKKTSYNFQHYLVHLFTMTLCTKCYTKQENSFTVLH